MEWTTIHKNGIFLWEDCNLLCTSQNIQQPCPLSCTTNFMHTTCPLSKLNKVTQIIHTNQNLWEMQESKLKFTQSWFPTWNTFLCIIKQHICHLLKHWSKTKMLIAPHDYWPTIHPKPISNNTKQQSTWPSTYKNWLQLHSDISIFDMLTFQQQNSKT